MPVKNDSTLPAADQFENPAHANPDAQLLGKKAEEYMREGGKIEDYPGPDGSQDDDSSSPDQP